MSRLAATSRRVASNARAARFTAVAVWLLVACHRERSPLERGASMFQRNCATCHGPDGRGTHPPGFSVPPKNLTDPELQARLSDSMLKETIRYGKGQMPNFGAAFSPREVDDLVLYVRSLRKARP